MILTVYYIVNELRHNKSPQMLEQKYKSENYNDYTTFITTMDVTI